MQLFIKRAYLSMVLFILINLTTTYVFPGTFDQTDLSALTKRYSVEFTPAESANIAILREDIENLRQQLVKTDRADAPMKWAEEQHTLGVVLRIYVEQDFAEKYEENLVPLDPQGSPYSQSCEPCHLMLRESLTAFRAALEVRIRKNAPTEWAETQFEMGRALQTLGTLEPGLERLKEAATAFRDSLKVYNRQKHPESWGNAQLYLAETLQKSGRRESGEAGKEYLKKSINSYEEALKVHSSEKTPDLWFAIQNNFGNTLATLGYLDNGKKHLQRAIAAFRSALDAVDRETKPLFWAATQNNLGNVLQALGVNEKSKKYLQEAMEAFRAALTERTPERDTSIWGGTLKNLADTLYALGNLETGAAASEYFNQSVVGYRAIIEVAEREHMEMPKAAILAKMTIALYAWGLGENDMTKLEEAVEAYRMAINIIAEEAPLIIWSRALLEYAYMLYEVGEHDSGTKWLEEAIDAYRMVWNAFSQIDGVTRADIIRLEAGLERAEKLLKERQSLR